MSVHYKRISAQPEVPVLTHQDPITAYVSLVGQGSSAIQVLCIYWVTHYVRQCSLILYNNNTCQSRTNDK